MGHPRHAITSPTSPAAAPTHDVWAPFRLMVIGELLQHPPTIRGERRDRLRRLSAQTWIHPQTGEPLRLGFSTIARWYDRARRAADPVAALARSRRSDRGANRAVDAAFAATLRALHAAHPQWTAQLLYDNAVAARCRESGDGPVPSYPTVRRYMRAQGLVRRRRLDGSGTGRALAAERRFVRREVERFECSHVGALVHWDFHVGSLSVCDAHRGRHQPRLLAFLDDRSRQVLHAQWYTEETARVAAHGFLQACAKHGLPRAVMSDNGAAMRAAEVREGFDRLGVAHRFTQVYSPYQNGKMECFWGSVEGRLLAMVRAAAAAADLDLARLNRLTAAWLQEEYQRRAHATTGTAPLERFVAGPTVLRRPWPWERMVQAFTMRVTRKVRRSVGTVCVEGVDFDLPPAWRHLEQATLRVARWDLSRAWLCHPGTGEIAIALCPADPEARSDGRRRRRVGPGAPGDTDDAPAASTPPPGLPPLLDDLVARFEAFGSPTGMLSDTPNDGGRHHDNYHNNNYDNDEETAPCTP